MCADLRFLGEKKMKKEKKLVATAGATAVAIAARGENRGKCSVFVKAEQKRD